jgi:hypothetical protein
MISAGAARAETGSQPEAHAAERGEPELEDLGGRASGSGLAVSGRRAVVDADRGTLEYSVWMESQGVIEFRYPDGHVDTTAFAQFRRPLHKGDHLEHDGADWIMNDREDRGGVTIYLCTPAT